MKNNNIVSRVFDIVRSAPLGLGLLAISAALPVYELAHGDPVGAAALAVSFSPIGIRAGGALAGRQIALKSRLERSIDRLGYRERIMATTTDQWCDRQTARVVCGASGHLQAYQELCERNSETAELTWLPHI